VDTNTLVNIILLLAGIIIGLVGAMILIVALLRNMGGGGHGHWHP
jgi:hypothetical protein